MLTNPNAAVARCQSANQSWMAAFAHYQEEIDYLLSQIADLRNGSAYRSLFHSPEQYHRDLIRLRSQMQQVRVKNLCEHLNCTSAQSSPCINARFGLYAVVPWSTLTDEFARLQSGCRQLFTNLLSLNLL